MAKLIAENLTDQTFWDTYWANLKLPSTIDNNFSSDRCVSEGLLRRIGEVATADRGAEGRRRAVLEIGAAPGKWLSLFPQDSYSVSGIEYSKSGMIALQKNLEMLSIKPLELMHGDFFSIEPRPVYDIVMSLGFIEHFEEPAAVVERHLQWLRAGGVLIIGVPNFTGIHGVLQRYLDLGILRAHNTSIMNQRWFASLGTTLNITTHSIDYLGSFEPALPLTYEKLSIRNFLPKAILRLANYLRRWRYFDKVNSPLISSYILGVYQKRF